VLGVSCNTSDGYEIGSGQSRILYSFGSEECGKCSNANVSCNNGILSSSTYTYSNCSCNASNTKSITTGAIVGIVIAILIVIAIVAIAIVFLLKYKRRKQSKNDGNRIQLESTPPSKSDRNSLSTYSPIRNQNKSNITVSTSCNDNNYTIKMSKLKIIRKIGEGAFGCVYLGMFNNTEVAIKKLSKNNITKEDMKEFMAEAEIMR